MVSHPGLVGVTAHPMDSGLDNGFVSDQKTVESLFSDIFMDIRKRFERVICCQIVCATAGLLSGDLNPEPQHADARRYYLHVYPRLQCIAVEHYRRSDDANYTRSRTSTIADERFTGSSEAG
jgi:methionyl-tRNA formyltransferase